MSNSFNKDPTYEQHMVPYSGNGLHHSHLITVATALSHTSQHTPTRTHTQTHTLTRPRLPPHTCIGPPCHSYVQLLHANNTHIHLPTNTRSAPFPPRPLERMEICLLFTFFPCCSRQGMCEGLLMDANDTDPLSV